MAITSTQRTEIVKATVAMFGAAPGGYMAELTDLYVANGSNITNFMKALATTTAFTNQAAYSNFKTIEEKATSMASAYGLTDITTAGSAGKQAYDYFVAQLTAGTNIGEIFAAANNFLATTTDTAFTSTQTLLANKAAVAEYYTVTQGGTSTTLTTLQSTVSSVTASTDVSTDAAKAAVIASTAAATTGETFTMTTNTDNVTGTAGNDTINAAYSTTNGMSFQGADAINGGAGTDTLNVTVGVASTYQASSMTNVEVVSANFTAAGTLSLAGVTGLTTVEASASTADAIISNLASTTTDLKVSNSAQSATFTYAAAAVSGTSDSVDLTVSGMGHTTSNGTDAITIADVETLNIASTTAANVIDTMTTASATTYNITGDQSLTIGANLGATVTTLNASASTGGVDVDFGAGAVTVSGGAGNDSFSFEAAGAVSATGGAGNDTMTFDGVGTLTSADTISGGEGTDTLVATKDTVDTVAITTAWTTVSGFEKLSVSDALAGDAITTASVQAGLSTVTLAAGGNGTLTLDAGANTVNLAAALAGGALILNDTGTATTDSVTIANTKTTAGNVGAGQALTIGGFETVTINTTGAGAATTQTYGTIAITADTGGTATLNLSGSNAVTTGAITATTVNASGLTGTSTFLNTSATGVTSFVGSANADTIVTAATATTVDGGAGADTITAGAGNDTIIGGDGNDSITAAGGNDSVTGGAGNDTVVMAGNLATGDVIDAGEGTDALSVTNASLTTLDAYSISATTALNTAISNFESVVISDNLDGSLQFDMARLDSLTSIKLVGGWTGAEELIGLANASTITLNQGETGAANALTLTLADATGTADSMTIALADNDDIADEDFDALTIASVETLTITANDNQANNDASVGLYTVDVTATSATTVTVTGTESVDLSGAAINATTITTTGLTTSTATADILGGSASQTITTGTGADTIDAAGGADTISSGAGDDVISGGTGADVITSGTGADSIVGGAGNDTISLTESAASTDTVVLTYSEAGAHIDTISGFTNGTSGDLIQFDISALEAASTSGGIFTSAVNFVEIGCTNATEDSIDAATATIQTLTAAATITEDVDLLILSTAVFSSADEVEDALEAGGSFALTLGETGADDANNAFMIVYSDGTNAKVAAVHVVAQTTDNTAFEAGNLNVIDLATITGVTSITSTTFVAANFAWIA